jgi:hypothetical protein
MWKALYGRACLEAMPNDKWQMDIRRIHACDMYSMGPITDFLYDLDLALIF